MTVYAIVDDEYVGDVATNSSWSAFVSWAIEQPGPELRHLAQTGWSDSIDVLVDELKDSPRSDDDGTRAGLLKILGGKSGGVLVVTDGVGGDDRGSE